MASQDLHQPGRDRHLAYLPVLRRGEVALGPRLSDVDRLRLQVDRGPVEAANLPSSEPGHQRNRHGLHELHIDHAQIPRAEPRHQVGGQDPFVGPLRGGLEVDPDVGLEPVLGEAIEGRRLPDRPSRGKGPQRLAPPLRLKLQGLTLGLPNTRRPAESCGLPGHGDACSGT